MNYGFDSAGRLRQRKDWVTGEEITYSYDPLGRPSAAATTSSAWGLSWTYDGFGNRLQQTLTKDSAPSHSLAVNGLTNQIIGQSYDLNGNLGQASSYDIENRPNNYWYSAANQRLLSKTTTPVLWFHGLDEELLGQFELRSDNGDPAKQYPVLKDGTERIYAGGRLLMMGWQPVSTNRLGSVVRHGAATTQNRARFATYTRDPDGSDYAWNRQYGTVTGRFTTPDPYRASGGPADPTSWNRCTYVQNDPVNFIDREGLLKSVPNPEGDWELAKFAHVIHSSRSRSALTNFFELPDPLSDDDTNWQWVGSRTLEVLIGQCPPNISACTVLETRAKIVVGIGVLYQIAKKLQRAKEKEEKEKQEDLEGCRKVGWPGDPSEELSKPVEQRNKPHWHYTGPNKNG